MWKLEKLATVFDGFTVGNWLTVVSIAIALVFGYFAVSNNRAAIRERKAKARAEVPDAPIVINKTAYPGGWRSVQVHIKASPGAQSFSFGDWRVESVKLIRPLWGATLARAENDDYATGVFFSDEPTKFIAGKAPGRPQRFALEFFIRFRGRDQGRRARFKIIYSRLDGEQRRTVRKWVVVPPDAA
jgi:hypothetical protein